MCIRMIPPEDVSVGSISATQSITQASPITTVQCTASSCQTSTTTPVRVTPVMVSPVATVTETVAPVTTAPVTVAPVTTATVTMAPTLCTKCDIAAIAPVMEANTVFENTNTVGVDGCTQTNAICRRTDDQVCTVTLSATNAAGTSTISSAMNVKQVSGLLTCQADGTYSSGSVTGITKLLCTFDTCVPACATCDTEAVKPLMNPPNSDFDLFDITPAGQTCKRIVVGCRTTVMTCSSVVLYAEIGTGGEVTINSATGSDSVSGNVDCGTDGKVTFGMTGPIVRFRCEFNGC
ncbi:hypothetical protein GCK72_021669 [Caenorhabditis remanei]|uniref:DUF281 domain-containing protein n=1 Tax=Caenorhabditis remanei TaxID=31234 RepID=A0A6A5GIS7_CAERE|nr:hypothetical protein GCK72_021669 [Caenorhabditis remanei]KAF1755100.1 hypothetical protein GCK72_021669 [Caenorhabditis remanei]